MTDRRRSSAASRAADPNGRWPRRPTGKTFFVFASLVATSWVFVPGCSSFRKSPERAPMETLAVLPVVPAETGSVDEGPGAAELDVLPPDAPEAVTAQIYGVLADQASFRVVPDLGVAAALGGSRIRRMEDLTNRAVALGNAVDANGVIFGRVFRFRERVGTAYGATRPASVSFELSLVQVSTGEIVWSGAFDRTQQSLSTNLLEFWMFWRAGPRWLTARELAGLGVEKLWEEMKAVAEPD